MKGFSKKNEIRFAAAIFALLVGAAVFVMSALANRWEIVALSLPVIALGLILLFFDNAEWIKFSKDAIEVARHLKGASSKQPPQV